MTTLRILTMKPNGYPAASHFETIDLTDDKALASAIRENLNTLSPHEPGVAVMTIMVVMKDG